MFKLSQDADINGTHRVGEITCAPATLVEKFGQPQASDGYKVSGEYTFENEAGEVFTLYDWKSTSLYDDDFGSPSPGAFWRQASPQQFNIGGRTNAFDFVDWLEGKVQ
jgi:hypothetical protein